MSSRCWAAVMMLSGASSAIVTDCSHCEKKTPEVSASMKPTTLHDPNTDRAIIVVGCRVGYALGSGVYASFFGRYDVEHVQPSWGNTLWWISAVQ